MTTPFEQYLLSELVNSTVSDENRKEDIDYHTIVHLVDRHIESEVDYMHTKAHGIFGLDEISLKKGYRDFVTLITYRVDHQVHILGVVDGG